MRNIRSVGAALSLSLAAALAACAPSLSGPKLDSDPNTPSSATPNQLLSSVQANGNILLNGPAARLVTMWVQQMSGTDRQYQSLGIYQGLTESNYDVPWQALYTGGGLVDIRNIQNAARAADGIGQPRDRHTGIGRNRPTARPHAPTCSPVM